MNQEELKKKAAEAAMAYVYPDALIGVGTGSTVRYFIEALGRSGINIRGAIASSEDTAKKLEACHIPVATLADGNPDVYIDGADSYNKFNQLIKGGGGALTREKVIATASRQFICIVDESKYSKVLGDFPLPVEVLDMARSYVAREIVKLGGDPVYRQGVVTDNGHSLLDIHHLKIHEPIALEEKLDAIPGVVCNGLFAKRYADIILVARANSIDVLDAKSPR